METKNYISKTINLKFFNCKIKVRIGNKKDIAQAISDDNLDPPEDLDSFLGLNYSSKHEYIYLTTMKPHIVAHECLHAALNILDHYQINYDSVNSEILCMTMDQIISKIFKIKVPKEFLKH